MGLHIKHAYTTFIYFTFGSKGNFDFEFVRLNMDEIFTLQGIFEKAGITVATPFPGLYYPIKTYAKSTPPST